MLIPGPPRLHGCKTVYGSLWGSRWGLWGLWGAFAYSGAQHGVYGAYGGPSMINYKWVGRKQIEKYIYIYIYI